jgi:hypothetical protein
VEFDCQFFTQFAHKCGNGSLARLQFAAGEFPQSAMVTVGGSLLEQDLAFAVDQSRRDKNVPYYRLPCCGVLYI